jgi:5-formyltetrahydrofolate cyclo-ligase
MAAPRSLSVNDLPNSMTAIDQAKRVMRARAVAIRATCDPLNAGAELTRQVLRDCPPPPGAVVSGFWPMTDEIDIRPLLIALHDLGHTVVLPVTPRRGLPLTFRVWRPGDAMEVERFGTMRPLGEPRSPDFLLVPLLAFDRSGGRLGYGGGYYDRALSMLSHGFPLPARPPAEKITSPSRIFSLGCAFAAQEVPTVPTGPLDVRLDAVATEHEIIRVASTPA